MVDEMQHYRDNLRHVVRPDVPDERHRAPSVALTDYEALYLARLLRDYAAYEARGVGVGIAWAYAEYIDMVVRDEGRTSVVLYAHTRPAYATLEETLTRTFGDEPEMQTSIRRSIDQMGEEVYE